MNTTPEPEQGPSVKMFPIQSERGAAPHPTQIPWAIAELAYSVYRSRYGGGQTLERLAERAGFGPGEMDDLLPGWREKCDVFVQLAAQLAAKDQQIAALMDECFNERHEAKALRGLLDNALADNKGKFYEGQSATDHGYVHVLAQKDAKIAVLLAARKAWIVRADDGGVDTMCADAACKALGLEVE